MSNLADISTTLMCLLMCWFQQIHKMFLRRRKKKKRENHIMYPFKLYPNNTIHRRMKLFSVYHVWKLTFPFTSFLMKYVIVLCFFSKHWHRLQWLLLILFHQLYSSKVTNNQVLELPTGPRQSNRSCEFASRKSI